MPTVTAHLDKRHQNKQGRFPIKLKVYHELIRKYYSTNLAVTEDDWMILNGDSIPKHLLPIHSSIDYQVGRAASIIEKIIPFSFEAYEKTIGKTITPVKLAQPEYSLKKIFTDTVTSLQSEGRLGYASGFTTTWNNITRIHKSEPSFSDITVDFLKAFHKKFEQEGKSITTIGIQLRNLRTVINIARDKGMIQEYPFGKRKYQIPTGKNVKKALELNDISRMYDLKLSGKEALARDIFYFSYLCNGMNLKDIISLKWKDIQDNTIVFRRAKTIRSNSLPIQVPINVRIKDIIDAYGNPGSQYIFPFLNATDTLHQQRNTLKLITKKVNEGLAKISATLGLPRRITTYTARHTFSTVLQRSGAPISFISEALGHSSLVTTQNYLAGFDMKAKQEWSSKLIG